MSRIINYPPASDTGKFHGSLLFEIHVGNLHNSILTKVDCSVHRPNHDGIHHTQAVAELQTNTWAGQIKEEQKNNHVLANVLLLVKANSELQ
jgi:hypothetical protein